MYRNLCYDVEKLYEYSDVSWNKAVNIWVITDELFTLHIFCCYLL